MCKTRGKNGSCGSMIKILCVGKIKEPYLNDLINDYLKRISKYTKIMIVEVKDNPLYSKEIEALKEKINPHDYNIALDLKGETLTSEELAQKIDNIYQINSNITFIVGGSLGLDAEIRNKADFVLSFSKFTFPHGLFRGILLEQIYRSFKINNHETYHK